MGNSFRDQLVSGIRIIFAIAAKDIFDALKNKTTLTILIGVSSLVVSSLALPMLLGLQKPQLVVFDEGSSSIISGLRSSEHFIVSKSASLQEMVEKISQTLSLSVGLVWPLDYDDSAPSDQEVVLQDYYVHWANPDRISEVQTLLEQEIRQTTDKPVQIDFIGNVVYPPPDNMGLSFMVSLSMTLAITTIGLAFVPHLFLEEREKHTMDALLVSPAKASHLVLGKAVAGTFYCLIAAAVVLAFYPRLVTHWGVVIMGSVIGSLLAVSLGLLMSIVFKTPQVVSAWVGVLIFVLLVPIYLGTFFQEKLPDFLNSLIQCLPSVALADVFSSGFSNSASLVTVGSQLGIVFGWAIVLLSVISWRLVRSEGTV